MVLKAFLPKLKADWDVSAGFQVAGLEGWVVAVVRFFFYTPYRRK
jgi:hypothetical protein